MSMKRLFVLLIVGSALLFPADLLAQDVTVKGKILDSKSQTPLAGATIKIKNSKASTISNEKGEFVIKAPSSESIVSITYVGFRVYETKAGNGNLAIQLEDNGSDLNDVIVVGYGTQKKISLTGSVGTIAIKDVVDFPVGNLSEALRGQIVGVSVSGGFQRPGQPASITIRNPTFFSKDGGSKDPIYVIDNIIRTKEDFDLLDVSEIDNISVLKDAAAAIYGIIGANGVIVVKTKRGKSGAASISYSATFGVSDATAMPKMMTGYQHATYMNNYLLGSLGMDTVALKAHASYYAPDELDHFKANNYNWLNDAWQKAYDMRHTLNISGGSDKATYFAGFSYNQQNSNFDGLGIKRYSFRSSSDIKLTTGLKLGLSLSANYLDRKNTFNKQGSESLDNDWKTLIGESPMYPAYVKGMPILIQGAGTGSNLNTYHYFAVHDLNNYVMNNNTGVNFQGQLSYQVPFIKGLTASVNFNKNLTYAWGKQYGTKYNVYDFNKKGSKNHLLGDSVIATYTWTNGDRVRLSPSIVKNTQVNATLNYDRTFGKHQITVLAGYEQDETFSDQVNAENDGVVVGGLDNMNFTTIPVISNEPISETGRLAYFGRLDYNYDNKYLLQAQFRADGSINFAPENRWGYFPSMSAGWVISEEKFFQRASKAVNFLKLRASVGLLGLNSTKTYQWLRSYAIQTGKSAVFGGNSDRGLAVVNTLDLANRGVHWDDVDKYNIGLDARFLNNRLSASFDAFLDKRTNMLSNLTSSPSILIGTPLPSENFGALNNFGFEASVTWNDNIGKDWSYNVTANFNWMDNKVLISDFPLGDKGTFLDPTGKSTDMGFYGYRSLGILRTPADVTKYITTYNITNLLGYTPTGAANKVIQPGMIAYADIRGAKDANGKYTAPDGKIDANDMDYIRQKQSNRYGLGLNWGVSYKSLSLRVNMGLSWGGIDAVEGAARKVAQVYSNRPAFWADHWTATNTNAAYPSPFFTSTYDVASDFWFRSSFTFRMTNFNLSYTLPANVARKMRMNSARIFLVGTNPINFFNPYDYKDGLNSSYDVFPQLRTFSLGLNVNL